MANINVNGISHQLDVEGNTPLLWVLREEIGLTGTKFGCGIAQCGACTVHVNGQAIRSCSVPVSSVEGKQITTIEGLSSDSKHPVQQAWLTERPIRTRPTPISTPISPTSAVAAPMSGSAARCIAPQL